MYDIDLFGYYMTNYYKRYINIIKKRERSRFLSTIDVNQVL